MKQRELVNRKKALSILGIGKTKFYNLLKRGKIIQYIYFGKKGLQKRYSVNDFNTIKEKYCKQDKTKTAKKS